ncbi:hypothetical protein JW859_11865 [bacterium]|nr:hypothetical protein [bacterium]
MIIWLVISASATAPVSAQEQLDLPTAEQVLAWYVDAVGGRAALERLDSRVVSGRFVHDLDWHTPPHEEVPITYMFLAPGRSLQVEQTAAGECREGWADGQHWILAADGQLTVNEDPRSKLHWLLDPRNALWLADFLPGLECVGIERIDESPDYLSEPAYVLEPAGYPPAHYRMYFSTETGLLLGIGYHCWYTDYRTVDGVQVPFTIVLGRKGGSSVLHIESVENNVELAADLFAAPETGARGR